MEKKNKLQEIEEIITTYTAMDFAQLLLDREQESTTITVFNNRSGIRTEKVSYVEYMKHTWGSQDDNDIDVLICRSRDSKLKEYAKYIQLYTGFNKQGKVFVLNKEDKIVSFLYAEEGKIAKLYTHYNPLEIDCIESSCSSEYLFRKMMVNLYDFSKSESEMIKECDRLIGIKL